MNRDVPPLDGRRENMNDRLQAAAAGQEADTLDATRRGNAPLKLTMSCQTNVSELVNGSKTMKSNGLTP